MYIFQTMLSSILVLVIIALCGLLARHRGVIDKSLAGGLARIVFDLGIPAMIFVNLATQQFELKWLFGAGIMILVELSMVVLAWIISRQLGLTTTQMGAVVLCAAFGTSATLGYSVVSVVFPDNHDAIVEAVLISELGVGLLIFTLGPIMAMYFVSGKFSFQSAGKSLLAFTRTPICISLVISLLWAWFELPGNQHPLMKPLFHAGHILANLVVPVSVLIISLNIQKPRFSQFVKPFGVVVFLKLLLAPLLAGTIALIIGLPEFWRDDLIIMAGMPPAFINVILLQRYGGDTSTLSTIIAGSSLLSLGTVLLVILILG
ncbi:MAG: AEC family transporter [Lewinellaceae bacterium]|nr:AEC family transporter [Lewinellaceae bacterium]